MQTFNCNCHLLLFPFCFFFHIKWAHKKHIHIVYFCIFMIYLRVSRTFINFFHAEIRFNSRRKNVWKIFFVVRCVSATTTCFTLHLSNVLWIETRTHTQKETAAERKSERQHEREHELDERKSKVYGSSEWRVTSAAYMQQIVNCWLP